MVSHTQIVKRLGKKAVIQGAVPPNTTLEQVLAAVEIGASSSAALRADLARKLLFEVDEFPAAQQNQLVSDSLKQHFTKLFTIPAFRTLTSVIQKMLAQVIGFEQRENAVIRMLKMWKGQSQLPVQAPIFIPVDVMPQQSWKLLASILSCDDSTVQNVIVAVDTLHDYMLVLPAEAHNVQQMFDLWNVAIDGQGAAVQPQNANPQAVEQPVGDVPEMQFAGADADGAEPPAIPGVGVGAPHALNLPVPPILYGPQVEIPAPAENGAWEVILKHRDGEPALISTQTNSRLAAVLRGALLSTPSLTSMVIDLIKLSGRLEQPAASGMFPSAARCFFVDQLQLLLPAGGGAAAGGDGRRSAAMQPNPWTTPGFSPAFSCPDKPMLAKTLLESMERPESFSSQHTWQGKGLAHCLVLDPTPLQCPGTAISLLTLAEGADAAIPFLWSEIFNGVDTSEEMHLPLPGTLDASFSLHPAAVPAIPRRQGLAAVGKGIQRACCAVEFTSRSLRPRLVALQILLLVSVHTPIVAHESLAVELLQQLAPGDRRRQNMMINMQSAIFQQWRALLITGAAMPTGLSDALRAELRVFLLHMLQQPAAAVTAAASIAKPTSMIVTTSSKSKTEREYKCPQCGLANHHMAQCFQLAGLLNSKQTEWLKGRFELHQQVIESAQPPKLQQGAPPGVDTNFDAFLESLKLTASSLAKKKGTKRTRVAQSSS